MPFKSVASSDLSRCLFTKEETCFLLFAEGFAAEALALLSRLSWADFAGAVEFAADTVGPDRH